jgi:hypothetical protein
VVLHQPIRKAGGGLEYAPVGLESLEITPFEYALLDEMYKQQEEPEESEGNDVWWSRCTRKAVEVLKRLFEDDLFQDVVFEDVDASMEVPEPVYEEDEYTQSRKKDKKDCKKLWTHLMS